MVDKRTDRRASDTLPPIWGDNSNLRMTNSHPATNEDALFQRAVANEPARAEETDELVAFITERYAGRE